MITLFIVSTFDGWDDIMNVAINSDVSTKVKKKKIISKINLI